MASYIPSTGEERQAMLEAIDQRSEEIWERIAVNDDSGRKTDGGYYSCIL